MIDSENLKKMSKDEIIECCSNIADWGFNDYESWEQQSAVYGLLNLYKTQQNKIASLEKQIKLMQNCDLEKVIEKQQKEIEELQIIADDIKGHNIVYTDTPEFEEKFISKDKIRKTIEDLEKHRIMSSDDFTIKVLKALLEENK